MTWGPVVNLAERRKARGMQAKQLAAAAGVSPQYLNDIERGRRDPTNDTAQRIADALGEPLPPPTHRVPDGYRLVPARLLGYVLMEMEAEIAEDPDDVTEEWIAAVAMLRAIHDTP